MNPNKRKEHHWLPLSLAIVGCLYGGSVLAQQSPETQSTAQANANKKVADEKEKEKKTAELAGVTVTGSLIKGVQYENTSPVQIITADTSIAAGQFDTAEFLQKSNIAAGSTQINNQFAGFVVEGGTGVQTVSLRGLGANRTLVLLDGQRPGPSGTRGQVGAFDFNVLPASIVQRMEIVKDGSSSIYGSDAVAGVINVITRKSVDRPEFTVSGSPTEHGGGERYQVSGATGWHFDKGNVVLAGQYDFSKPLRIRDRDYFQCAQDLAYDKKGGNRIDRVDKSIIANSYLGGCSATNLYADTVIDALTGVRYNPSADGSTVGLIPGFRPRPTPTPTYLNSAQPYFTDVLNYPFWGDTQIIDRLKRYSVYAASDFSFDAFNWKTQLLYTGRANDTHRFRQFFPLVGGNTAKSATYRYANSPNFASPVPSGVAQPIMPFPSDQKIKVDYFYGATKLEGIFNFTDSWTWEVNGTFSRSSGDYSTLGIDKNLSGDVNFSQTAPSVNYFDPGFLNGSRMSELVQAVGAWDTGNTIYKQATVNAVATGELFTLPAGAVGSAVGAEYRYYSIDDEPGVLSKSGRLWGSSSAQTTKGNDRVKEVFGEFDVPVIKGMTGVESLSLNASARAFSYDSVDSGWDRVWKLGANWQVNSFLRFRSTLGTSYRAPGLYELYLGNQSGFVSQTGIDPCINWGESTNDFIRKNCAAAGIPNNYTAAGTSSATVYSGGGKGYLVPETSRAKTVGLVLTPGFANLSIAVDYFDYKVANEIGQLSTSNIIGGCYGSPVYPNNFCNLLVRNAPNAAIQPNAIVTVQNKYININKERTRGYDLLFNYDNEFSFGKLAITGQFTYTLSDVQQLFSTAAASGFNSSEYVGDIGRPRIVGNLGVNLKRGDWSYYWMGDYVHATKALSYAPTYTYLGFANAWRDNVADQRIYHTVSVRYDQGDWAYLLGIRNLLDTNPPTMSSGMVTRYGNVPAFATQYDWYGRTLFFRVTHKF